MNISISQGRMAKVWTDFKEKSMAHLSHKKDQPPHSSPRRLVKITISILRGEEVLAELSGEAVCNPLDQFDKEMGRKLAMRRAFDGDGLHALLTKEDRATIVRDYLHYTVTAKVKKKKDTAA